MHGLNLRTKLSLSFLLILLPLLGLVLYTYHVQSETWTASILEDQMQTAQAVAAIADANFDQAFAFAWAVANDPVVHTMNPPELDPHLQQLKSLYPQYAGVAVNNAAGDLVGTSSPWPPDVPRARDALNVPYLVQVLKNGQPVVSPVFHGRGALAANAFVGVAVPVRDTAGSTTGVVSVPIPLEELSGQLKGMTLSSDQNILLTDPQGTAALITSVPALSWEQRNLSGFPPVTQALQGKSSKLPRLVLPFSNEARIGAFMASPKYRWIVGVTEREDVALAPILVGLRDWLLGLAGVATLSLVLILFISNRLVQPIRALATHAQILGRGDLSPRVRIQTGDELEELGRTFNQMADEIQVREERLAQLASIVQSSDDAISSATLEGVITSWNKGGERLYGYTSEEMIGRAFSILIPPDYVDDMPNLLKKIGRGEPIQHFETVRLTKDGKRVDVSLTASPIRNAAGEITGMSAIARDITERKSAEREREEMHRELERRATQLQIANQELESFTYSVSHDLRAPLASIDGISRLLQEDYGAQWPEGAQRHLSSIRSGIQQMSDLITGLLSLSRLSRQALKKQRVDMNQLVADAIETVRPAAQSGGPALDVRELQDAEADPVLLKQVWVNLIGNAVKFTRHCTNARVEVGSGQWSEDSEKLLNLPPTGHHPRSTVYYVRDNGVGFDMEQADRLFGVFQRLHSEEEYEGNGVGLAIVARIVRRHGGRVWAEATVGQGATFYFTLSD